MLKAAGKTAVGAGALVTVGNGAVAHDTVCVVADGDDGVVIPLDGNCESDGYAMNNAAGDLYVDVTLECPESDETYYWVRWINQVDYTDGYVSIDDLSYCAEV